VRLQILLDAFSKEQHHMQGEFKTYWIRDHMVKKLFKAIAD